MLTTSTLADLQSFALKKVTEAPAVAETDPTAAAISKARPAIDCLCT